MTPGPLVTHPILVLGAWGLNGVKPQDFTLRGIAALRSSHPSWTGRGYRCSFFVKIAALLGQTALRVTVCGLWLFGPLASC